MTKTPVTPAIGIDLGTAFSVVAHLDAAGRPRTIPNSDGDFLTPSVVLFDGTGVVVGKEAVKVAALEPDRVAEFAKREMGNQFFSRALGGERLPPEVIQSLVLEKLKRDAELQVGAFTKCVITVPAFFNEPRRKATQDAGQLAGLDVLDIINEPTAAAIAFGYQNGFLTPQGESRQTERILVYDLGGGTFDVTLMEIAGRRYTALATAGDVFLGGLDWDRRIADIVAEQFMAKHRGLDPRLDSAGRHRLLRDAEDAKRTLSVREQATVAFEHSGLGIRISIPRKQFEQLTADLLQRTQFTVKSVLKDAGLGWEDITRLLLVGGSTRMPMVQAMLEQESGLRVDRSVSADEAVAHGAAIYAGLLLAVEQGETPLLNVRNVNSHDLGILAKESGTDRPRMSVIIPRNTPLPATKRRRFRTHHANQKNVAVNVIEGGNSSGQNSAPIGACIIRNLPPNCPAGTPVEVQFTYAENGRLTVFARVPGSDKAATLTIDRTSGLSDELREAWGQRLRNPDGPLSFS